MMYAVNNDKLFNVRTASLALSSFPSMKSQIYGFVKTSQRQREHLVCVSFHFRKEGVYALQAAERKEREERLKTQPSHTYVKNRKNLPSLPSPPSRPPSGGYFAIAYYSVQKGQLYFQRKFWIPVWSTESLDYFDFLSSLELILL